MEKFEIRTWVDQQAKYRPFRQAVHVILSAIAGTPALQARMIMKGGVLLALSYRSSRYTKDIDFSTALKRSEFDLEDFREQFESSLLDAVETLGYGMDCRVQSCVQQPNRADATFPTIRVGVGYAYKGTPGHKRLRAGNGTDVVHIDYSLNEPVEETELFELEDGGAIQTYSLVEMIAEKLRAVLQQESRKRNRRQDIYDLHHVLSDHPLRNDPLTQTRILARLLEKCRIRELSINSEALSSPEIRRRSEVEYASLADEIEGALPPFGEVYESVEDFYHMLPWTTLETARD